MKKFFSWQIVAIIIFTLFLGLYDLPQNLQEKMPFIPKAVENTNINLGLDLQGGSQLDYKIDLRKVPEAEQDDIVEGVKEVIERRVNSLGVAEPNIYVSNVVDETHIVVELAETTAITDEDILKYLGKEKALSDLSDDEQKLISLEKAKDTVGKTIQLEFKEEKAEIDPEEESKVREKAQDALSRIQSGDDFAVVGQEEAQAYPGKVRYDTFNDEFEDQINSKLSETITSLSAGQISSKLIETGGSFTIDETGQPIEEKGLAIVKLISKEDVVQHEKEVDARHILIAYEGAERAQNVTRSKSEAEALAKEVLTKANNGEDFATLAQNYSDDITNKDTGGRLETPVADDGAYSFKFQQAALELSEAGEISDVIETEFGFHIIKADTIRTNVTAPQYNYSTITFSLLPDRWQETGLTGEHFVHADVQLDSFYQPLVVIQFDDEGAKLFEEITSRNVGKRVAIFVGGDLISAPTVNEAIAGGSAHISGNFTPDEAKELARDLNTGAIPAPIVLTGEYTIGATLGQTALNDSLKAGAFGLILILLFMPLIYRMAGLIADISLVIYGIIFLFLLKSGLHVGIALGISFVVFFYLVAKIANNKDSGWEKLLSFILACAAFFFLTFLLKTGVVLTLAGIAGIILSIGMAVDANILIFERFKEEIRQGKTYGAALEEGFDKAWSAIRDSNFSTLLICAILFLFGSSMIKGFAFTLAAGVVVSMFTAITITRILMRTFIGRKIAENPKNFGASLESKSFSFDFIKKSKIWLAISGILIGISIIAGVSVAFGQSSILGLDFTGGTLLEFKFSEPVEKAALTETIQEIGNNLNPQESSVNPDGEINQSADKNEVVIKDANPQEKIDFSKIQVTATDDNGYIVKTPYMTSEIHDQIIAAMKDQLPEFTEPRFTTIGPTLGASLLWSAFWAIIIALIVIILYVAFAFRRVPKEVSPWRFGAIAIIALAHDIIIVTGLFIILSRFFDAEIDSLFVTAMLTVFGYSVNDTIVIFDRIRDNLIKEHSEDIAEVANGALNQTLARSTFTSLSTLFALVAILLFGSPNIFFFVLALTAGTIVGTYSSIFVASPLLVKWSKRKTAKS